MEVPYRKAFLCDLKKLKKQPIYNLVFELVFTTLPQANALNDIINIKAMSGQSHRYRIRVRDYRVGIEVIDNQVDVMRVLHRRDFYRFFP